MYLVHTVEHSSVNFSVNAMAERNQKLSHILRRIQAEVVHDIVHLAHAFLGIKPDIDGYST
jgi:hypothetical protein